MERSGIYPYTGFPYWEPCSIHSPWSKCHPALKQPAYDKPWAKAKVLEVW